MFFHYVKNNDTVYKLSKQYNIPVNQIIKDNNLKEPYLLLIGECLIIKREPFVYVVKKGDTISNLSYRFSLPIEKIVDDNNLTSTTLEIGKKLLISYDYDDKVNKLINGFTYQGTKESTLNQYFPSLTHISPFAYRIKEDGHLLSFNVQKILDQADEFNDKKMMVVANIKESGGFSSSLSSSILNSEYYQNNLINDIKSEISTLKYNTICIDFEYVNEDEKNQYIDFLRKLKNALGSTKLFVALAPKNSDEQKGKLYTAHDYYAIGQIADYVILMTYEWGYTYGEPLPIAPINEVRKVIRYAKSKIDKNKIIMGIPNYGYDWTLPYKKGNKADSISNVEAMELAKKYKVEIKRNKESQTPFFNYKNDGIEHIVHFDDACSFNKKINLALDEDLAGVSIWTISTYCPQLVELLNYYYTKKED